MEAAATVQGSVALGPVTLQVADLERSLRFYEGVIGMRRLASEGGSVALGTRAGRGLLTLREQPDARRAGRPARLGLYHVAYLLPDRSALGRFAAHVARAGVGVGAGDHLVSEALYLSDPDGLGVEVYADRPRHAWRYESGQLQMATDPVDVHALIRAAAGEAWLGLPEQTVVGHVHLHVADLARAERFYGALGLEVTVRGYPGALFLAADGYHHHVAVNTWAGAAARPAADDDARLLAWSLVYRQRDALSDAAAALAALGEVTWVDGAGHWVVDPSGTPLRLTRGPKR